MIRPESSTWLFQPELYPTVMVRYTGRYLLYRETYNDLFYAYQGNPSMYAAGTNISTQAINQFAADNIPYVGQLEEGFIYPITSTGQAWNLNYWSVDAPDPEPGEYQGYWDAMCTGLMLWQMQSLSLGEQIVRFAKLGHYGRHKEE